MKFTRKTRNIARGLIAVFSGMLVVSLGARSIVETYRGWIDTNLGTVSSGIVTDEPEEGVDLYNYRVDDGQKTTQGMYNYQKDVAIRLSEEGMTLLKNDSNTLPLKDDKNVTLLGRRSYNNLYGGAMGSSAVASESVPLTTALKDQGFTVDQTVADLYTAKDTEMTTAKQNIDSLPRAFGAVMKASGYTLNEISPSDVNLSAKSSKSGTAIVTVGRPGSEAGYYLPGEKGKGTDGVWDADHDVLGLSIKELETLKYARDNYSKVIVLVNADSAMDLSELFEDGGDYEADAVLWVGLPGSYGFIAAARILDGTVNPSGSITDIYATKSSVSAANQNYDLFYWKQISEELRNKSSKEYTDAEALIVNSEKSAWYMPEPENIYVGYRYYETRYFDCVMDQFDAKTVHTGTNRDTAKTNATQWNYTDEVVAGFGYGLSYSAFTEELQSVSIDESAKTVTAKVKVTNSSETAGKHAVQLYVSAPYTTGGIEKSAIQLIGYGKTKTLEKNASEEVTITASFEDFASYDSAFEHNGKVGGYILDEGTYYFSIGNGAHDALNNVLAKMNKTTTDGMDTAGDAGKTYSQKLNRVEITRSKNGTVIENQLQDMELSNFEKEAENGKITELSRSNWNSTWPKTLSDLKYTSDMEDGLRCKVYTSTETDNGGTEIVWGANTNYSFAGFKPKKGEWLGYDDPRLIALVQQVTLEDALVAVTQAGGQNWDAIPSIEQPTIHTCDGPAGFDGDAGKLSQNWNEANKDYQVSEDDPYGQIQMRPLPTAPVIGATMNRELVNEAGGMIGQIGIWTGIAEDWGPGANIHRTPYNSRNHEYYSEDPVLTATMLDDYCSGAKEYGLVMCPKHFAFNDTDMNRSGVAPFMSEQRARELELRAFQKAYENESALGVMGGFNRAGATFASAHKGLNRGILRGEWGFKGLAVTDMVNPAYYMNPRDSIMGSGAAALTGSSEKNITEGVNGWGELTVENLKKDKDLQQAVQDVIHNALYVFLNSNATNGLSGNSHLVYFTTWYDKVVISAIAVSATLLALSAGFYVTVEILSKKGQKKEGAE